MMEAAQQVLHSGSLQVKLTPWPRTCADDGAQHVDVDVVAPARDSDLRMRAVHARLPAQHQLGLRDARVQVLARFAHHELMAVELFAWALLRFPQADARLRLAWWAALREEQQHCRLYLERLALDGARLEDVPQSGYFWELMPHVRAHRHPLAAFLAMQGLTLEQANLDFTIMYRDAFARVGDTATAAILQQVHDDEVGHVHLANHWLQRSTDAATDVAAYVAHVPFPLSAARAKGRNFEVDARRRAGMSAAFIDHVRNAQPVRRHEPIPSQTHA
jgi:uncharacterized ferritin-like protein (DUF455 family)